VVQLSSETHKKPALCGFFVACDLSRPYTTPQAQAR
jgi:hypothetical protein